MPTITKLPSWDDARSLLAAFKGHALMTVASKVCLGFTLMQLKEKECFSHGGDRRSSRQTGDLKTWDELLQQELGIPERTAARFITAACAVKEKIKKIGGQPHLLSLLDQPVQSLSTDDADALQAAIRTATDGESLTSLLQEFKLIKLPHVSPDGSAGGSAERTKKSEHQLAWDFAGGDVITELAKVRTGSNFQQALLTMPLSSTEEIPFGLYDYVAELKAAYTTAEKILISRTK